MTTAAEIDEILLDIALVAGSGIAIEKIVDRGNIKDVTNYRINDNKYTLLHYAASKGFHSLAKKLLSLGADPNVKTIIHEETPRMPLWYAGKRGYYRIIDILCEHGAVMSVDEQWTYLQRCETKEGFAVLFKYNQEEILHRLFARPARRRAGVVMDFLDVFVDSDSRREHVIGMKIDGVPLLHIATREGWIEVVERLLSLGVDVNCLNAESETALHVVARCWRHYDGEQMCELLCSKGADPKAEDVHGCPPYVYAGDNYLYENCIYQESSTRFFLREKVGIRKSEAMKYREKT